MEAFSSAQTAINSFGWFSPFAVIILFFVTTAIPPLPLPTPAIEIAAGLIFGFWKGAILCWVAQIVSSSFAFYFARLFGKRLVKHVFKHSLFNYHRHTLKKGGAIALMTTRLSLVNPFNVVSFLAGLTQMSYVSFLMATMVGCIPEVLIFVFIGSRITGLHL